MIFHTFMVLSWKSSAYFMLTARLDLGCPHGEYSVYTRLVTTVASAGWEHAQPYDETADIQIEQGGSLEFQLAR